MIKTVQRLRFIGIAEGISFLVLLMIAMPLKYLMGAPLAVKIVGWAHGILFILYLAVVPMAIKAMKWNAIDVAVAFGASLVPGGTFMLDKSWRKREQELKLTP